MLPPSFSVILTLKCTCISCQRESTHVLCCRPIQVSRSSWFAEFQRDIRTRVFGALQVPVRGFGSATQWTARNILAPVGQPFRSCYSMRTTALQGEQQHAALPTLHALLLFAPAAVPYFHLG